MQMNGELRPATLKALDAAWSLQSAEGHWPNWVKCNWPPFEQDDHYGVTLMVIAMGMAPESYTHAEPAQTESPDCFLRNHEAEEVHHRAMMLWAAKHYDGLITMHNGNNDRRVAGIAKGERHGHLRAWRQRALESATWYPRSGVVE
jgi:squalene-hopene/tetraprenyl-beta-curcumene cyclase